MKIKKVVIDGFRAYENAENGTFDFSLESGECADFVAIYAPNGFGKTSFYDAVEYALTDNISRFVRDGYRSDYDSKSKAQLQRKRKQYILRNHSIPASTTAKIEVTLNVNGRDSIKTKEIPKPKSGSRDFHFKKRTQNDGCSGLSDVFLSQEAIDAFLREEKADARYTRFMASFGDSGEIYRANIATLKRELESTLQDTRALVEQVRAVAERPIKEEIFVEVNSTIAALAKDGENIDIVGANFNAERELALRNTITKRSYELSQLHENYDKAGAALTQLVAEYSQFAAALKKKAEAQTVIAEIAANRGALKQRELLTQQILTLRQALSETGQHRAFLSRISTNIPLFEAGLLKKKDALESKLKLEKELEKIQVDLSAIATRDSECKRRIDLADSKTQELLELQKSSSSVYSQIDAKQATIRNRESELDQHSKAAEALVVTLHHSRQQLAIVSSFKITVESVDAPELALISSDEFSPIELRAACVEMRAKHSVLTQAAKSLELVKSHASTVGQLVDLGRALVSQTGNSHCPLCSHTFESYQALVNAILGNDKLSAQEASALAEKQTAESAFDEVSSRVENLLRAAQEATSKRLENIRETIQKNEQALTEQSDRSRSIESELAQARAEVEKLRELVFRLPPQQFSERIAAEINQLRTGKGAEMEDRVNCSIQAQTLQTRQKDLLQALQAEQSKADAVDTDESYRAVIKFCEEQRVDTSTVSRFLLNKINDADFKIGEASEKLSNLSSELFTLEERTPSLATWDDAEAIAKESNAGEALLSAEGVIVPFVTAAKLYAPQFDTSDSKLAAVDVLTEAATSAERKKELSNRIRGTYTLLEMQLVDVLPYVESLGAQGRLAELQVELGREEALEAALNSEYQYATGELNEKIQTFFYPELINAIYRRIDPHPDFKRVEFACDFEDEKPTLEVFVADQAGDLISPNLYFSAAQVNILSLSIFLARALHAKNGVEDIRCIFIDDPIHSMDSINVLSTIDLLRSLSLKFNRQIILSTHDRNFFELLQRKLPAQQCKSKFLELATFGKVVPTNGVGRW
jgi:exonuclease SbcC